MKSGLSIIVTLFKTPVDKIKSLNQYKNHTILIFDQATKNNSDQISKILDTEFEYFHSEKNLGLSKSTNFLITKVKTKYCLFTQADIKIDEISIDRLIKSMNLEENIIFAGPVFNYEKKFNEKNELTKNYKIKSELDASIMMCDVEKVKQIGFFDEDYFLYWEDKDLMKRVNKSSFKMIQILNSFAIHDGGKSTFDNTRVKFIRRINYKYGELIFDLKHKKLRTIKILRQIFQNIFFLPLSLISLNKIKIIENISKILGIIKFIKFIFLKKNSKNVS
jgi:GT2 family glycosyltransferase